ncbi:sulfurtransferase TusA family protein [Brevibacillus composti]|uniref:Sulfurtransferase TusA family protein n=1 Tax=Brevibacillus composti TaxID=2796470 RepID=A0A7T5JPN2_9BACL|nr:sulfurtransferase TusA family protein [Brevibacillus composti]QQE75362.1 sulfurtransferase TusA family protein [Brevibacillus composti]QUO42388.1 sulfurtransferase TusA family protein [Brevibacillus composti]
MNIDVFVDAKGLSCPMPIVKAKKAIDAMESGQIMQVDSTDKGSVNDFQGWVRANSHELLKTEEADGVYRIFVRKG